MYTAKELALIAQRYYPANMTTDDPHYFASDETSRLRAACKHARPRHAQFAAMVEVLKVRHPDRYVADETMLSHYPCFRVRMSTHPHDPAGSQWTLTVACISVLAPVYMVYASETWVVGKGVDSRVSYASTNNTLAAYSELCEEIEHRFAVERIPPEIGLTVVPDLQTGNVELGKATVYDCIFTADRR